MPVAPARVSPTRTALTAETAHLPSTVPSSLRGGHPGIHDHPRGLPCNWVDYYEGPRLFTANNNAETIPNFPVDGIGETADRVFGAIEMAGDAKLAGARLKALNSLNLPKDTDVLTVKEGKVTRAADGTLSFKQEPFGEPAVAKAKAAHALAGVRTLKRTYEAALNRKKENRIWGIVNNSLIGAVALAGVVGTILAIIGLAAAGPVGWVTLALGTGLAVSKAVQVARNNNQKPVLNDIDERRLKQLQEMVRKECEDHATAGHTVTTIQFKDQKNPTTVTQLVSEILNAGTEREGDEWFDAARAFGQFGAERLFNS